MEEAQRWGSAFRGGHIPPELMNTWNQHQQQHGGRPGGFPMLRVVGGGARGPKIRPELNGGGRMHAGGGMGMHPGMGMPPGASRGGSMHGSRFTSGPGGGSRATHRMTGATHPSMGGSRHPSMGGSRHPSMGGSRHPSMGGSRGGRSMASRMQGGGLPHHLAGMMGGGGPPVMGGGGPRRGMGGGMRGGGGVRGGGGRAAGGGHRDPYAD